MRGTVYHFGIHIEGVDVLIGRDGGRDGRFGAKRGPPLTIAGPKNLRARLEDTREVLFPGSDVMSPKLPVT